MKHKKYLKIFIGLFLAAILIVVFFGLRGKKNLQYKVESLPDGEGLVFYSFNKNNRKSLELKCKESREEGGGKTSLTLIDGLIFKKGRMNKDIRVTGDHGYVENDFNNFYMEKNAKIISEDFSVKGDSFTLKDQAELHSQKQVVYKTDALAGNAVSGMDFFINLNTVRFNNTSGSYLRENRSFDYKTDILWFMDKDKLAVLEKEVLIRDGKSFLKSDWVSLKFTDDLKHIIESSAQKNSYLYYEDQAKGEIKEIKAEIIKSNYDADGNLVQLVVMQNVRVVIKDKTNHMLLGGQMAEMLYDGPSGRPTQLKVPLRGTIENTGKRRFKVTADKIDVLYDEKGEPRFCTGKGKAEFVVENYNGISDKLDYNIEKNSINLTGDNARLESKNNTFRSNVFLIDSKKEILSTNNGIRSIVQMEGENVLLSKESVYVNSKKFTVYEKEKRSVYEKDVNLTQGNTRLTANLLDIAGDNTISVSGNVVLSFTGKRDGKNIYVKGDQVNFIPKEKRIDIITNAIIRVDETILRAVNISVWFNKDDEITRISGEKNITFSKGELTGNSDQIDWLYTTEEVILTGNPYIVKKVRGGDSGKTRGKELKIDLKTDKITILSDDTRRTETVIKQD